MKLSTVAVLSMAFLASLFLNIGASVAMQEGNSRCEYGTNVITTDSNGVRVVPTFHSMGVYWSPSGISSNKKAYALFGEVGSTEEFRRSLDFIYSADDAEYRGSIVHLKSGTEYEISLVLDGVEQETLFVETWCEQFPVAETRFVPTGVQNEPFVISNVHGSPDGYIVYTADPNGSNVLDAASVANNIIIEDSSYVILRGLTLKNAKEDAIILTRSNGSTHDIVIENNVIENWGDKNDENGYALNDNAISTNVSGRGNDFERLIIQRNVIRNPRFDANSWKEYRSDGWKCTETRCHPKGAKAISLLETAGNHVIRYNEIYSTNGNYFFDGIGGGNNKSFIGALNKDSDIYGNSISQVWDDAIEAEGGDANVRIWGNYIDLVFTAIAISPVSRGPAYIFRNIIHRTQYAPGRTFYSGYFIKAKSYDGYRGDGVFIFHNTIYRHDGVGGVTRGIYSLGTWVKNFTSRNNIIDASKTAISVGSGSVGIDFDYDLHLGELVGIDGDEQNGMQAGGIYDSDPSMQYALAAGALGHDDGSVIPNFSDNAIGLPDMGAQENGAPPLEFGILAYPVQDGGGNSLPRSDFSFSCVDFTCDFSDQSIDDDGNIVSWSWNFGNNNTSDMQSPTHTYLSAGNYAVSLVVTDNDGAVSDAATQVVTLAEASSNQMPIADDLTATTNEDTPVTIMLTGSDADGNSLTFTVVDGPANGSLSGTAPNLTYTPNSGYSGTDSFSFKANDGQVDSMLGTATITINRVNQAPVAHGKKLRTQEQMPVTFLLDGSDPDGDSLTFTVVDGPTNGSLSGTAPNVTYTPDSHYTGPDGFTFKVSDGEAESSPAEVSIAVELVDEPLTITDVSPGFVKTGTVTELLINGTGFGADTAISLSDERGPKPEIAEVSGDRSTIRILLKVKRGGPPVERTFDVIVTSGGSTAILEKGLIVRP